MLNKTHFSTSISLRLIGLTAFLLVAMFFLGGKVSAVPATNSSNDLGTNIQKYCKQHVPKALVKVCEGSANTVVVQTANAASYHCKTVVESKQNECIQKAATQLVAAALATKPKTVKDFNLALDKVLANDIANTGGSISVAYSSNQPSATSVSVDPAACAADPTLSGCDPAADPNSACGVKYCNIVQKYVQPAIDLVSLLFGFIVAISLIAAGIQYSSAGGDSSKVTAAKSRITNTILALIVYAFFYAFIQFLVPGGVF